MQTSPTDFAARLRSLDPAPAASRSGMDRTSELLPVPRTRTSDRTGTLENATKSHTSPQAALPSLSAWRLHCSQASQRITDNKRPSASGELARLRAKAGAAEAAAKIASPRKSLWPGCLAALLLLLVCTALRAAAKSAPPVFWHKARKSPFRFPRAAAELQALGKLGAHYLLLLAGKVFHTGSRFRNKPSPSWDGWELELRQLSRTNKLAHEHLEDLRRIFVIAPTFV